MHQAMGIPDGKAAVDKGRDKLKNLDGMASDEGQEQEKRGLREGTDRRKDCTYFYAYGRMPQQKFQTEQGSSASQMTAAKVLDGIARLLDAKDKQATQYELYTPKRENDSTLECS